MNYDEALEYIHGVSWTFCKPGLERIKTLCERLGHPENSLKFIHVAGTNGKGSFCTMMSEILMASGLKVGLYTSPYILEFGERMRVNGKNIPKDTLAEITELVKPVADAMEDKPTEFELITAIAFEYFRREAVDVVVLECGLGGRLDSTNVISTPILSVITGIALDHTALLGNTVEEIAAEKAGIIKPAVPVLFGGTDKDAERVIKERADEVGTRLYTCDYMELIVHDLSLQGTKFSFGTWRNMELHLLGEYQPRNASLVLSAVEILRTGGVYIPESAVREGLIRAVWHARFEVISNSPLIIYDGAHNPDGIDAAVRSIKAYFGSEKLIAVTGVLRDKDYDYIARTLSGVITRAYTIKADNPRALTSEEYRDTLARYGVDATATDSIDEAVRLAYADGCESGVPVICLGSLYTYGDVIRALEIVSKGR